MSLGKNIQYLRKQKKITQEQLAEIMSVSRQTISRWEADEIVPELNKLVAVSDVFSCKLDTLVKEDMAACDKIYSEITVKRVKAFRMARYVMVTPKPEELSCFEHVYEKEGLTCMDVYMHVDSVVKADSFTNFSQF